MAWALNSYAQSRLPELALNELELNPPRVISVTGVLAVDGLVAINVTGLDRWSEAPGHSAWLLVPFINGRALNGLYPTSVNTRTGRLQFDMSLNDLNRRVWIDVLSPPTLTRHVRLSVGLERQDPMETELDGKNSAKLIVVKPLWALMSICVTTLCGSLFLWLSLTTSLLTEKNPSDDTRMRFSLAKIQLAIWFFSIFASFILIWLATGNFGTINLSVISLLGISAGTAVGDAYIGERLGLAKSNENSAAVDLPRPADSRRRMPAARRLLQDILSDDEGYSIYRFQMLAWTVVLTMVFLSYAYYRLAMPIFNVELLYLLGLSSGTYMANRIPEARQQASIAPVPSNARSASSASSASP